jgi:hypothetical protein
MCLLATWHSVLGVVLAFPVRSLWKFGAVSVLQLFVSAAGPNNSKHQRGFCAFQNLELDHVHASPPAARFSYQCTNLVELTHGSASRRFTPPQTKNRSGKSKNADGKRSALK